MSSKKYRKLRPIYDHFGREYVAMDFSDNAFEAMYVYESNGGTTPDQQNGYFWAKRMIDITVAMWREDVGSEFLPRCELYDDPNYPNWWLDKVLPPMRKDPFWRHPLLRGLNNAS